VYTRTHIHKWTHIDTRCCTHRSTLYKHTHFHMCRHIQTCIHILTHTYTHGAHTHTHTYTHIHRMHTLTSIRRSVPSRPTFFIYSEPGPGHTGGTRAAACRPCASVPPVCPAPPAGRLWPCTFAASQPLLRDRTRRPWTIQQGMLGPAPPAWTQTHIHIHTFSSPKLLNPES